MKVILDTNFLLYCAKQKIDYVEQIDKLVSSSYVLVAPEMVVRELKNLSQIAPKYSDKKASLLALKLLKVNKVQIEKLPGRYADDAIKHASSGNIIATHDLALAEQVEKAIVIRGMKKLAFR